MAGMEDKQPVSTMSSVSAAVPAQLMTPPLVEGRSVAFPSPEPEIVQVATTPVPEMELTVEVGDRPTTRHLQETVLYSVDDNYMVKPVTPSLSALGGDQQTTIPPIDPTHFYTWSPYFYNRWQVNWILLTHTVQHSVL